MKLTNLVKLQDCLNDFGLGNSSTVTIDESIYHNRVDQIINLKLYFPNRASQTEFAALTSALSKITDLRKAEFDDGNVEFTCHFSTKTLDK